MKKKVIVWAVVCAFLGLDLAPMTFAQSVVGPSGTASATVGGLLEFSLKTVKKMQSGVDVDPFNQGTDVSSSPSFAFGNLTSVKDTTVGSPTFGQFLYMRGDFFYYVLMIAATSGRRYKITETGTQLASGVNTLPKESILLIPDYQWKDQQGIVGSTTDALLAPPTGASVGPVTSACLSNSLIYQSDNSGLGRLVRAIVAISGPAAGSALPFNWSLGSNGSAGQGIQQFFDGTLAGQSGLKWKPITPDQPPGTYSGTVTFTLTLD